MNELFDLHAKGTAKKLDIALQMQNEAVSAKSALRRIQLAGYTREQKAFEAGKKEAADVIDAIYKLVGEITPLITTEAGKKSVLDDAPQTAKDWSAVKDQVVALVDQGKPDEARDARVREGEPARGQVPRASARRSSSSSATSSQAGIAETDSTFTRPCGSSSALLIASVASRAPSSC